MYLDAKGSKPAAIHLNAIHANAAILRVPRSCLGKRPIAKSCSSPPGTFHNRAVAHRLHVSAST